VPGAGLEQEVVAHLRLGRIGGRWALVGILVLQVEGERQSLLVGAGIGGRQAASQVTHPPGNPLGELSAGAASQSGEVLDRRESLELFGRQGWGQADDGIDHALLQGEGGAKSQGLVDIDLLRREEDLVRLEWRKDDVGQFPLDVEDLDQAIGSSVRPP